METVYLLNCLTSQIGGRRGDRCLQPLEHSPRSRKVFAVVLQDFADQFLVRFASSLVFVGSMNVAIAHCPQIRSFQPAIRLERARRERLFHLHRASPVLYFLSALVSLPP